VPAEIGWPSQLGSVRPTAKREPVESSFQDWTRKSRREYRTACSRYPLDGSFSKMDCHGR